jgi:hypothetical protein
MHNTIVKRREADQEMRRFAPVYLALRNPIDSQGKAATRRLKVRRQPYR